MKPAFDWHGLLAVPYFIETGAKLGLFLASDCVYQLFAKFHDGLIIIKLCHFVVLSAQRALVGLSNKDRIYYRDYQQYGQAAINYI